MPEFPGLKPVWYLRVNETYKQKQGDFFTV